MAIPVQTFFLHPGATGTLQARIQQMVAEGVLSGRLRRGEKMPSTRALARHLGVSRLTVALAYTELLASDYLTSRQRSGHFISDNAPAPAGFPPAARQERVDWARAIGQRFAGGAVPERPQDWASYRYPFIYGQTDEYGYRVVENSHTVRDLHATVLTLLGLDYQNLTYRFGGRDYRLADVDGHPIRGIIA